MYQRAITSIKAEKVTDVREASFTNCFHGFCSLIIGHFLSCRPLLNKLFGLLYVAHINKEISCCKQSHALSTCWLCQSLGYTWTIRHTPWLNIDRLTISANTEAAAQYPHPVTRHVRHSLIAAGNHYRSRQIITCWARAVTSRPPPSQRCFMARKQSQLSGRQLFGGGHGLADRHHWSATK